MFRVLNIMMALLFTLSAIVQLNDPDPVQWFLIYAAGALICAMSAAKASHGWQAPALIGLTALVWGVWIMVHLQTGFAWGHIAEKMKAETPAIEESRETLGLFLLATWMFVIAARRRGEVTAGGKR